MIMSVTQGRGTRGCISYALEGKVPPEKEQEETRKQLDRDQEKDFSRTVSYTFNPAKDAVILDHNLTRQCPGKETARSLSREMKSVTRPGTTDPVAHFYMRFHRNDLATKDPATLRSLTREALERFRPGLTRNHQYVATLHDAHSQDPHVHIVVNRVPVVSRCRNAKGKMTRTPTLNMWQSKSRCLDVCEIMELAHPDLMRHLSRDNELPRYIREKPGAYRGQQRNLAQGKTPKPSPRRQMFDAVIPALQDDMKTTNWYTLSQSSTMKQAGITVLVRTGPGSRRSKDYIKNFEPVISKHIGQKVLGVRFMDKSGRSWAPKEIHSKFKASTIQKVLDKHLAKEQRIAIAKDRDAMWKELGLAKMEAASFAEMRAERAKVRDTGKTIAKLKELEKTLGGSTDRKLTTMEKKQEAKDQGNGKGQEERSTWTTRGQDLDR